MSRRRRLAFALGLILVPVALRGQAPSPAPPERVVQSLAFEWNDVKPEPTKVGAVRRFFKLKAAAGGELAVHVTTLNAGESPHPPHRHPEEELVILREGTLESSIEGQTRRLGPGSVMFHAANELHGFRNVGSGPATYHVIKWGVAAASQPKP